MLNIIIIDLHSFSGYAPVALILLLRSVGLLGDLVALGLELELFKLAQLHLFLGLFEQTLVVVVFLGRHKFQFSGFTLLLSLLLDLFSVADPSQEPFPLFILLLLQSFLGFPRVLSVVLELLLTGGLFETALGVQLALHSFEHVLGLH